MCIPNDPDEISKIEKETKNMLNPKLTWEQLDACRTADAVANLLKKAGVKGIQLESRHCPLANATGWRVTESARVLPTSRVTFGQISNLNNLTRAEKAFVRRFDTGKYPEIIKDHEKYPYKVEPDTSPLTIIDSDGQIVAHCGNANIPDNQRKAAFIVCACNNYEIDKRKIKALMKALKGTLACLTSYIGEIPLMSEDCVVEEAHAALKLARVRLR